MKLDRLRGSLSAGPLGNSMSSGRFNSAYGGSRDMELRSRFSFRLVQTGLSAREISLVDELTRHSVIHIQGR